MYRLLCSIEPDPSSVVLGGTEARDLGNGTHRRDRRRLRPLHAMTLADALDYTLSTISCKVDRAAMAVSLETRAVP